MVSLLFFQIKVFDLVFFHAKVAGAKPWEKIKKEVKSNVCHNQWSVCSKHEEWNLAKYKEIKFTFFAYRPNSTHGKKTNTVSSREHPTLGETYRWQYHAVWILLLQLIQRS